MSGFRGCGAIATTVSLCFPQAVTESRRQHSTQARSAKVIEVSPGMCVRASYTTGTHRGVSSVLPWLTAAVAEAWRSPSARHNPGPDRPARPLACHGHTALPLADLRAAVRQEFLVRDRRNDLDGHVGGWHSETPTCRIASPALGGLPVVEHGDRDLVACQGNG